MTQTDLTRPQGINRLDPVLRDAASELGIVEFRAETLADERERADRSAAERAAAVDTEGVSIESRSISGAGGQQLNLRFYRGRIEGGAGAPLLVCAHGGGFVSGNLDTDHAQCVELAREGGCLVVSVDYRLAPENPAPAALDDVEAGMYYAIRNCAELNIDSSRLAVMGRDAGAALVASLAQRMFDNEGPQIRMQILHQPMLDSDATPSRREFQRTPGLNGPAVSRAWGHYLGPASASGQHVPRTERIWRACRRRSSAAPRSTRAATKPSTTPTGCCMPSSTPNCMSSRRHSMVSIRWCRIGLSRGRTGPFTRNRFAAYSGCSCSTGLSTQRR